MNADQVRLEAKYRGVAIYVLHLKTPSGVKDHASAEAQYNDLSLNPYLNKPLYYPVEAGDLNSFGKKVDSLAAAIASQMKAAYSGENAVGSALGADPGYDKQSKPDENPSEKQDALLQQPPCSAMPCNWPIWARSPVPPRRRCFRPGSVTVIW